MQTYNLCRYKTNSMSTPSHLFKNEVTHPIDCSCGLENESIKVFRNTNNFKSSKASHKPVTLHVPNSSNDTHSWYNHTIVHWNAIFAQLCRLYNCPKICNTYKNSVLYFVEGHLRAHEDNSLATPKFFAMPRKNYLVEENKRRQVIPAHRNSRSTTLSGSFESEYHRLNHELQALCVVKSIADTRAQ